MSGYLTTMELFGIWKEAAEGSEPHASIRIGDGEAVVAAHEEILTMDYLMKTCAWAQTGDINYCGATLPNRDLRERLVCSFRQADCLGILSQTDRWLFKPLAEMVVLYYDLSPPFFFYAFDNYHISMYSEFYEFFRDKSVLLVGAKSGYLENTLIRRYGWTNIAGTVDCRDWTCIDRAIAEMDSLDYRIALVSAGVPGKILAAHAKSMGKVGLDFGSGADACIEADADGLYAWEMKTGPKRNFGESGQ